MHGRCSNGCPYAGPFSLSHNDMDKVLLLRHIDSSSPSSQAQEEVNHMGLSGMSVWNSGGETQV